MHSACSGPKPFASALMKLGIPADDIHAISRGKRALAVPTPDGVAEPRNRRVVIIVR